MLTIFFVVVNGFFAGLNHAHGYHKSAMFSAFVCGWCAFSLVVKVLGQ